MESSLYDKVKRTRFNIGDQLIVVDPIDELRQGDIVTVIGHTAVLDWPIVKHPSSKKTFTGYKTERFELYRPKEYVRLDSLTEPVLHPDFGSNPAFQPSFGSMPSSTLLKEPSSMLFYIATAWSYSVNPTNGISSVKELLIDHKFYKAQSQKDVESQINRELAANPDTKDIPLKEIALSIQPLQSNTSLV